MQENRAVEVPCPLCAGTRWVRYVMAPSHYGPEKHQVTRCCGCGMIYTNPQSQSYHAEVENRGVLERHFRPEVIDRTKRQGRFLLRLLEPYSPGKRLLDFGCGAGGMVKAAVEQGWQACGYDLNHGLVDAANRHWQFDLLETGPLEDFQVRHSGEFDAIISYQVFEHLQRPVEAGMRLVGLLKPGGVLLIDVPFVFQPGEWFSRGKTLDPTSHFCHFSIKTLKDLGDRLGCDVLYRSAAPSLVALYHRFGFERLCYPLGVLTKAVLPPIGTGVCMIVRKVVAPQPASGGD